MCMCHPDGIYLMFIFIIYLGYDMALTCLRFNTLMDVEN